VLEMRAAVLRGPEPMVVEQVELDGPEASEVLVRIVACGVCHSDFHVLRRARAGALPIPTVLGHEAAGVVEAVGSSVHTVEPGDHVVLAFRPTCGRCPYCVRGTPQICERPDRRSRSAAGKRPRLRLAGQPLLQGIGVGGFAEYTVMPEGGVIPIRKDVPLETVCLVGCAVTTGVGAVIYTAHIEPGCDVAVLGLGGVGLNIVQGARLAGARRIIGIDRVAAKFDLARQLGATDLIDASSENVLERVQAISGGYLDYAFEAIGRGETVRQAFEMIRPGGTAVAVGLTTEEVTLPGMGLLREKKLVGSMYGSASVMDAIPRMIDLYCQGQLCLDELISKRRPLEEINEAFADLQSGAVARSVLMIANR